MPRGSEQWGRKAMAMFSNNRGRDTGFAAPTAPGPNGSNGKRGMFSVLGNDVMIVGNIHASADL